MYLCGAGGHAKVVMDILQANGLKVDALIDNDRNLKEVNGVPVIYDSAGLSPFIISIGSNATRKRLSKQLGCEFIKVVHPSAIVSPSVIIKEGTVVMQGAIIQVDTCIGKHCIINTGVSVDHECRIGDYVHLSPHSTLCGNVEVGEGTWIGAGTTVIQGVKIGRWCVIGAGSVVTKDIPDGVVAVGITCRPIKMINQDLL